MGDGLTCQQCGANCSRTDNYQRHKRKYHPDSLETPIQVWGANVEHNMIEDTNNPTENTECITSEETIGGNLKKMRIPTDDETKIDPLTFFRFCEEKIRSILKEALMKIR
jgi:hypothetical protein